MCNAAQNGFPVIIYHNPGCGTSRNTLAMIAAAGYAPEVVPYLQTGWTRPLLEAILREMGQGARAILRERGTPAEALGLLDPQVSDEAILAAMLEHPVLVNRPIVRTPKGTVLARPSERVFAVLDRQPAAFTKEDGEVVRPASGA